MRTCATPLWVRVVFRLVRVDGTTAAAALSEMLATQFARLTGTVLERTSTRKFFLLFISTPLLGVIKCQFVSGGVCGVLI